MTGPVPTLLGEGARVIRAHQVAQIGLVHLGRSGPFKKRADRLSHRSFLTAPNLMFGLLYFIPAARVETGVASHAMQGDLPTREIPVAR